MAQSEPATGQERLVLQGHHRLVTSVQFSPDGKTVVSGGEDGTVRLWEAATGKQLHRFEGHRDTVTCVAFAPDGQTVISSSRDSTALIWDLKPLKSARKPHAVNLSANDLDSLWVALAGEDAAQAYRAICTLAAAPEQAVPFLQQHLRPDAPVDSDRITQLIADLDSNRFAVRQKAAQELENCAELAEPALQKKLLAKPSDEVCRRIERLLENLKPAPSGQRLRSLRSVEVLEYAGTLCGRLPLPPSSCNPSR